jgi:hypothetical protein
MFETQTVGFASKIASRASAVSWLSSFPGSCFSTWSVLSILDDEIRLLDDQCPSGYCGSICTNTLPNAGRYFLSAASIQAIPMLESRLPVYVILAGR